MIQNHVLNEKMKNKKTGKEKEMREEKKEPCHKSIMNDHDIVLNHSITGGSIESKRLCRSNSTS